jgi:DNA modification methylase
MPTLDWIGKKAVINHHNEVPYRLLRCNRELSVGDPGSGNLLVQGDNLEALKALLPYYAGKVKCIYIDPPYNTGKESWKYNDAVNSPEMRTWLGKVVGREADDLCRHDKWLCMMYPRMALAQKFLSIQGAIFVSIDDTELPGLRVVMDELFGQANRLACFTWKTEGNFDNQAKVKECHEYVLAYAKDYASWPAPPVVDPNTPSGSKLFRPEVRNTIVKNGPKNPVGDVELPEGFPADFESGRIEARTDSWPHYDEAVVVEDYRVTSRVVARSGWSSRRILTEFIAAGFRPALDSKGKPTTFVLTRTGAIECIKNRAAGVSHVISYLWEMGSTQQASSELAGMGISFSYPKPMKLIQYLMSMVQGNGHIVMDFFAGSATTAHAVLRLNAGDQGKRRFILVEIDDSIARDVARERLSKVVLGYVPVANGGELPPVAGLGGGFRYCELGPTLFDAEGRIQAEVSFRELAQHVYFTETGEPLPTTKNGKSPLLGVHNGTAVYLLYNGILKDKTPDGGNVLTKPVLAALPAHDGSRVVYGNACLLGQRMLRDNQVTFRQVPYEIRTR